MTIKLIELIFAHRNDSYDEFEAYLSTIYSRPYDAHKIILCTAFAYYKLLDVVPEIYNVYHTCSTSRIDQVRLIFTNVKCNYDDYCSLRYADYIGTLTGASSVTLTENEHYLAHKVYYRDGDECYVNIAKPETPQIAHTWVLGSAPKMSPATYNDAWEEEYLEQPGYGGKLVLHNPFDMLQKGLKQDMLEELMYLPPNNVLREGGIHYQRTRDHFNTSVGSPAHART